MSLVQLFFDKSRDLYNDWEGTDGILTTEIVEDVMDEYTLKTWNRRETIKPGDILYETVEQGKNQDENFEDACVYNFESIVELFTSNDLINLQHEKASVPIELEKLDYLHTTWIYIKFIGEANRNLNEILIMDLTKIVLDYLRDIEEKQDEILSIMD